MWGTPHPSRRTSTALSSAGSVTVPSSRASRDAARSASVCASSAVDHRHPAAIAIVRTSAPVIAPLASFLIVPVPRRRRRSLDPVPDPGPADVRDPRYRAIALIARDVRVVHEEGPPAHVLARHEPPVAAVLRRVPVVAHHPEVAFRYHEGAPVVVRRLR